MAKVSHKSQNISLRKEVSMRFSFIHLHECVLIKANCALRDCVKELITIDILEHPNFWASPINTFNEISEMGPPLTGSLI